MQYFFFDDPGGGIILALVLEGIVLLGWIFQREKIKKRILLLGPALILAFLLLDWLVQTNREKLEDTTRTIVQAAQDEAPETIIHLISDNFIYANGLNKSSVSRHIRDWLAGPFIMNNNINEIWFPTVENSNGTVEFKVSTVMDPQSPYSMYVRLVVTEWRFKYVKESDGQYRLTGFEMLSMDGSKPIDIFSPRYRL